MSVPPPKVDRRWVPEARDVPVLGFDRLVRSVMEMRELSHDDAQDYVDDRGREAVSREHFARWGVTA